MIITKEFCESRIAGKKAEIEKLEKKIARIEKAKATDWNVNPYWYSEDDLRSANKDLDCARKALAEYEEELVLIDAKDNSRNVKAIIDFLEGWKKHVKIFYVDNFNGYYEEQKSIAKLYHDLCDKYGYYEAVKNEEYNKKRDAFYERCSGTGCYHFAMRYVYGAKIEDAIKKLDKDIEDEAKRKYDFIVNRVVKLAGEIKDATDLKVSANLELNGIIICENGKVKVTTIGAGGYNIQCFHYRVLVKKLK